MNSRKLVLLENRLNRANIHVEARKKVLIEKGLDEKNMQKDSVLRNLLAEVRKVKRSVKTCQREWPKVDKTEKPAKGAKKTKDQKASKGKKSKKAK